MPRVQTERALRQPSGRFFTLHCGDARRLDELLGAYSSPDQPLLTCTITSPPYADLKDYGHPDQIGHGQEYDEYLTEMRRIFRLIGRHTRSEGSMWLVADSLLQGEENGEPSRLRSLPFDLAQEATAVGWTLREVIIWRKDKTLPWSGRGRLRNSFEYVLFFVRTSTYKYNVDRIRDPVRLTEWWVKYPERYNPEGKVPQNVWEFPLPVQGSWGNTAIQHACPLPPDLVERLIFLSTDEGDVVFDPFAGSGVVVAEAQRLGRRGLGIELVDKHVKAFHRVVRPEILQRRGQDRLVDEQKHAAWLQRTIVRLRGLKFPRVLWEQVVKRHAGLPRPQLILVDTKSRKRRGWRPDAPVEIDVTFVVDASPRSRTRLLDALKDASGRQPASKFGISAELRCVGPEDTANHLPGEVIYLYVGGRTWFADRRVSSDELPEVARTHRRDKVPPLVADVRVKEAPRPLVPSTS